ncbi:Ig-like domain-containing protein, partial [Psychromonas antarctica]|uniref:Ig-like domain-containing protein n=1 Tax=Psychromonas antarctica TaxID=67573 RepID=UPI001EE8AE9C
MSNEIINDNKNILVVDAENDVLITDKNSVPQVDIINQQAVQPESAEQLLANEIDAIQTAIETDDGPIEELETAAGVASDGGSSSAVGFDRDAAEVIASTEFETAGFAFLQESEIITDSSAEVVEIIANSPPIINADNGTTDEDSSITVAYTAGDVDGIIVSTTATVPVEQGTVSINQTDSTITFTPAENFNGDATITLITTDNDGATATTTSDIAVTAVTDAMSDGNEAVSTAEDTDLSGNVLDNVSDADSSSHSVTSFSVGGNTYNVGDVASTSAGTITITSTGAYTFSPATNFVGNMPQVTYALVDNNDPADTDTSTLDIAVTAVTDAMSDGNEAVSTAEDTDLSGNVLDNVSDADSSSHSVTSFSVGGNTYNVGDVASTSAGTITITSTGA